MLAILAAIAHGFAHPHRRPQPFELHIIRWEANPITGKYEEVTVR